jgi:hypothetical protein
MFKLGILSSGHNRLSMKFEKYAWLPIDAKVRKSLKRTKHFSTLMAPRLLIKKGIVTMGNLSNPSLPQNEIKLIPKSFQF